MSKKPSSSPAEDLIESLMNEVQISETSKPGFELSEENGEAATENSTEESSEPLEGLEGLDLGSPDQGEKLDLNFSSADPLAPLHNQNDEATRIRPSTPTNSTPPASTPLSSEEATRASYSLSSEMSDGSSQDLSMGEELDLASLPSASGDLDLPDPDRMDSGGLADIPDPDRMGGGGALDLPDPDRLGGGLDLPDPDRMDSGGLLDIPDPDRMDAGGISDIPDPDRASFERLPEFDQSGDGGGLLAASADSDQKTTIRGMADLRQEMKSSAPLAKAKKEDSTKTINLEQMSDGGLPQKGLLENESLNLDEPSLSDAEKTVAVTAFANRNKSSSSEEDDKVKVSIGTVRSSHKAGQVYTSADATLLQAENLRIVQQRILELEKEIDHLREENEELSSAAEVVKARADELTSQMQKLEVEKKESEDSLRSEIMILKGNLQYRDQEIAKSRIKVEELESRLKLDLKKIRVRERELENRLELSRAEKNAIVRSKDEHILELKRKMDQMQSEMDSYRNKCLELNKVLESNNDSFKKTTRALRLALANLELTEEAKAQLKKVD